MPQAFAGAAGMSASAAGQKASSKDEKHLFATSKAPDSSSCGIPIPSLKRQLLYRLRGGLFRSYYIIYNDKLRGNVDEDNNTYWAT
jgi:hypothetical protein